MLEREYTSLDHMDAAMKICQSPAMNGFDDSGHQLEIAHQNKVLNKVSKMFNEHLGLTHEIREGVQHVQGVQANLETAHICSILT